MTTFRIAVTGYMEQLLVAAGRDYSLTPLEAFRILMTRFEVLAKHDRMAEFGLEWVDAARQLNTTPKLDTTSSDIEVNDFDVRLLEKNLKSKSNFAGVYAAGGGSAFRATVPDPVTGQRYLASHPTALAAAIERFKWFEENGVPYGNLGKKIEQSERSVPDWTMEEHLENAVEEAANGVAKTLKYPYTQQQAQSTLDRYRATKGIASSASFDSENESGEPNPTPKELTIEEEIALIRSSSLSLREQYYEIRARLVDAVQKRNEPRRKLLSTEIARLDALVNVDE